MIDITSSPVKRSQSSEFLPESTSDMYSSITDSDSHEYRKLKSEDDCYFHNPKWPVWSRCSDGVPCEELIVLILKDASKRGASYGFLCYWFELSAYDNGSWDISTPRKMYKVEESDNKGNISVKRANSAGPDVYTLCCWVPCIVHVFSRVLSHVTFEYACNG